MRLLFPIGSLYPSQAGGPSNAIYWQAKALIRKNIDVTLVSTNADIPPSMCDQWLDTNYGKVRYATTRSRLFPIRLIWHAILKLPKVEIVHLTALFTPLSSIIAFFSILFGKKIVWSIRGELSETALGSKSLTKRVMLWCIKRMRSRVIFHVTSNEEWHLAKKTFGEKQRLVQVPNLLELPIKISSVTENYLLYLGRVHSIKALENFIEAASLSETFLKSDFRIKIVGNADNDYGIFLKEVAKKLNIFDKIDFVGKLTGIEKEKVLAAAKYLILPSHSENFGNVVVEALAQGTPVIASTGTPWQVLETTKSGFWTSNQPEKMAETIEKALNLSAEHYDLSRKNAYELVKSKYDVAENIGLWIEAYKKIV